MNFSFTEVGSKSGQKLGREKYLSHASVFSNIPVLLRTVVKIEKKGNFLPVFP